MDTVQEIVETAGKWIAVTILPAVGRTKPRLDPLNVKAAIEQLQSAVDELRK